MISGAKFGMPVTLMLAPSVSVSPTLQRAVVGNADDVAGHRLLGQFAVVAEKEHRVGNRHVLAGAHVLQPHAALEGARDSRTKAMRSRWLASMLACTLNTKPDDLGVVGLDRLWARPAAAAAPGAQVPSARSSSGTLTDLQRRAEDHRRQMAGEIGLEIERREAGARQLEVLEAGHDHRVA